MATDDETRDPMRAFSRAGLLEAARQSVPLAVSVGASLTTVVTFTATCTGPLVDCSPPLSLATTVNAFSVPLAFSAAVQ